MLRTYLKQPLYISWHITALAGGILLGTALFLLLPKAAFGGFEWLAVALALFTIAAIKRWRGMLLVALVSGVLVGLYLGAGEQRRQAIFTLFYEQNVTLKGRVADDTTYGPAGDMRLRLNDITIDEHALPGEVWVSTTTTADVKRGDVVTVAGKLSEGFGTMSAAMFRARLLAAERPSPGDIARKARDRFGEGVERALPEPESKLGMSFLVGQRRQLPETLNEQLRILGLTHLVVASGFHLTIVVGFARRKIAAFSKYQAAFLSMLVIGAFLLLTGFSTSMTRASLVAVLSLLAWYYGRQIHPVVLLTVVAAITIVLDPGALWGDIGWFLSFSAFAGVIILAPLLHHYFWGEQRQIGSMRRIVVATTAAQITTFPVIAYTFGQYSPLALVSNLLILPLVPIAMMLTFVSGTLGLLLPAAASALSVPTYGVLYYMTSITDWLTGTRWAYGEIAIGALELILAYLIILLVIIYLWRRTKHNFRLDNALD